MGLQSGLATSAVYNPTYAYPYFTKCDDENLFGNGCKGGKRGINIPFFKELSRVLNESIKFTSATSYGLGGQEEEQSAFKQLLDGRIDFVGPQFEFVRERDMHNTVKSVPLMNTKINVYFATHFTGTRYNIFEFAKGDVLALILCTAVLFYFLHFFYKKRALNVTFSLEIGSGSTVAFLVVANVLLNMFSSRLSAELARSSEWKPRLQTMEDLQKLVEMSSKVVLLRHRPITGTLERKVFHQWNPRTVKSFKQKVKYVGDEDEALKYAAKKKGAIVIANDVQAFLDTWKAVCTKLTAVPIAENALSSRNYGFYFSPKSLNRTKNMRQYISKHHYAIGALYKEMLDKYLSLSQKYWMCRESPLYTPSVRLTNLWNTSLKSLLFGLATSMGILIGENVVSYIEVILRRSISL